MFGGCMLGGCGIPPGLGLNRGGGWNFDCASRAPPAKMIVAGTANANAIPRRRRFGQRFMTHPGGRDSTDQNHAEPACSAAGRLTDERQAASRRKKLVHDAKILRKRSSRVSSPSALGVSLSSLST